MKYRSNSISAATAATGDHRAARAVRSRPAIANIYRVIALRCIAAENCPIDIDYRRAQLRIRSGHGHPALLS
ncbi:hypothetical protein [Nocardia aurantia]|uniref:Uncharacterized protein n=1 Tax=Nocardia aurantia TaxID=2585199 RepID=A0A7K0DP51_9NOCA|nr:hypothetical protein [Nocardia aurantia]MQY27378.1 hypothetical protein [Nocardia aurantia]